MSKQKDIVTTKDINKAAFRYMIMLVTTSIMKHNKDQQLYLD